MTIKTVTVAGASGNIGSATIDALIKEGAFTITAWTRPDSTAKFPDGVIIKKIDMASPSELRKALKGQDALVCALAIPSMGLQPAIVEAAAEVGVKRIIPCEFTGDLMNENTRGMIANGQKVGVQEQLKQLAADGKTSWTGVATGQFLEYGLTSDFILNIPKHSASLYDGGDSRFSMTSYASIGRACAGVLVHEEETKNRVVYVQDVLVNQNSLLEIAKKYTPGVEWKISEVDSAAWYERATKGLQNNEYSLDNFFGQILRSQIGAPGFGQPFEHLDNHLLGLTPFNEIELEAAVKKIVEQSG
jgi:hypothetical protein